MIGQDLPKSLVDAAAKVCKESAEETAKVADFVKAELKKLGANTPGDLTVDQRKELFKKVDANFKSDSEVAGNDKTVNEADTLDMGTTRFFQVEVVNGETGDRAIYKVAADTRADAEQQALASCTQEGKLFFPNMGDNRLVVDSTLEIGEDEYNNPSERPERDANKPG